LPKKRQKKPRTKPTRTKSLKTPPSCLSKERGEKANLKAGTIAGTHGMKTNRNGINHGHINGRHQQRVKAKGNPSTKQQTHMTLKVFGATFIKSTVTLPSGALTTRTAQAESQLQRSDLGVILATPSDILLPLVGPIHPAPPKGKANHLTAKVSVERGRTVMVTGNGRAQIFRQDTPSKLHLPYMTNLPLLYPLINGGTIKT
jgi:hypothetical protein